MDQKAFLALTAMLNSFPQGSGNPDLTIRTFEAVLGDVSSQAIIDAAQKYTGGSVADQNTRFAPTVAEFATEARRIHGLLPYRGRALPSPQQRQPFKHDDKPTRIRMGFKMSVLSAGISMGRVDDVAEANRRGLEDMIALGQQWGVPVPDELFEQARSAA